MVIIIKRRRPFGLEHRGYTSAANRMRAVHQLKKQGYDHFLFYRDTAAKYAMQMQVTSWVEKGVLGNLTVPAMWAYPKWKPHIIP